MDAFKVVQYDNYNRETVSDVVLLQNLDHNTALLIRDALRTNALRADSAWYKVMPQEQQHYTFEP